MNSADTGDGRLAKSLERLRAWRERAGQLRSTQQRIRDRARAGLPIRVGFFVMYDSAFPGLNVALRLVSDSRFDPVIVLIPDTLRGHDNMRAQLAKSARSLGELGIPVVSGYDDTTDTFVDVAEQLDFVCASNPYDELTHEFFTTKHLHEKSVLPFFISYGFGVSALHQKIVERETFRSYWRVFIPSSQTRRDYRQHANILPGALEVTGYPKMDDLVVVDKPETDRPMIIIAPHHTVREWPGGLELSTFLTHAETFRELPARYPQVDFVFRPHPLLFVHLAEDDLWGPERSERYLDDLRDMPNVEVDLSDSYMQTFAQSSALIHDCGSFTAEYLITGRPALFLSAADRDPADQFNSLGQQCLAHHYHASSTAEIVDFIDAVVLAGRDPMKDRRTAFAASTLMAHHPHAAERIAHRLRSVLPRSQR